MPVIHELRDGVLLVTIDNPPVNALSQLERQGLIDAMADAGDAMAVVIRGTDGRFIAGADVREFGKPPLPPHLPDVVDAIERCARPVVAAIDGQALGGGLEIALGCHYRLASGRARLGLPEVTLGLVPGAGGTQRLPRLIAVEAAAEMIVGGKPISATRARTLGLVDEIVEGDLTDAAIAFARQAATRDIGARRLSARPAPDGTTHRAALEALASVTRRRSRGAEAPLAALALVETALALPFAEGVLRERETFLRLRAGDQSKALRHVFLAERAAAKPPLDTADAVARPVRSIGVVGAGTMGTGIAMSIADAGLPVTLVELSADAITDGLDRIGRAYRAMAEQGRLSSALADLRISAILGSTDYAALADCDVIIEAAFETMDVKREIFSRLNTIAKPGAILASNTSYLDLDTIASESGRAADVVGLHYFSPANVMKLLEIVRGKGTSPDVLLTALSLAKLSGKMPVVAGVCNGFIGNRCLRAYNREAGLLVLEGALPEQVDRAMTGFGMAMGPFAVADLSGIDVGFKARQAMAPGSYEPLAFLLHDALVEAGHLGRKTGSGFYTYASDAPGAIINPILPTMIETARAKAQSAPRVIDDAEIVERCVLAIANEGDAIVDEGIAARASDIDVVFVNGYGFPRHRGGPMYFASQRDSQALATAISRYASGPFGHWWHLPR